MGLRAALLVLIFTLTPACSVAADQRLSDLLLQIQRLQREVQRLHGRIDLQQHELSILKRRQREQYLDLDARLRDRSAATPPQPASGNAIDMEALQAPRNPVVNGEPLTHSPPEGVVKDDARRGLGMDQHFRTLQVIGKEGNGKSHYSVSAPQQPMDGLLRHPSPASGTPTEEQQAYHNAFDRLKQRRYEEAIRGFEDLLTRYPSGEFADNVHYRLGETNYVKHDYATALTQFQRVMADYPLSPKIPASLLNIGYIHYEKGDWQRARGTLQDMIEQFPDTTEARQAESRLERMTREEH